MTQGKKWLPQKDYNFIYGRVPRLCVDLVIRGPQGVLLTWRKIEPAKNTWHVPGGRVNIGETLSVAAVRIAKAELGIKIRLQKFLGFMEFPSEKQNGKLRHTVSLVFLAKAVSGIPRGAWQGERPQYFKKLPIETYPIHARFLLKNKLISAN